MTKIIIAIIFDFFIEVILVSPPFLKGDKGGFLMANY